MALASLTRVKSRVIQILNANRAAYAATIGTGNNGIGAYKSDVEINDAVLEADALVITDGYFQGVQSLRKRFFVTSTNLLSGAQLPEFTGIIGKAEYSPNGSFWFASNEADSKTDVLGGSLGNGYVGANTFIGHHFFEEGYVYHTSPFFRIEYPSYTKTTDLQSLDAHESALVAGALMLLYKESSLHSADYYGKLFFDLLEKIKAGSLRMKSFMPKNLPADLIR